MLTGQDRLLKKSGPLYATLGFGIEKMVRDAGIPGLESLLVNRLGLGVGVKTSLVTDSENETALTAP